LRVNSPDLFSKVNLDSFEEILRYGLHQFEAELMEYSFLL